MIATLNGKKFEHRRIHDLPNEIIEAILVAASHLAHNLAGRFRFPSVPMQVCRRWRTIVLEAPRLWTSIHICKQWSTGCISTLNSMISRSCVLPLEIEMELQEAVNWIQPHLHRAKSLIAYRMRPGFLKILENAASDGCHLAILSHFSVSRVDLVPIPDDTFITESVGSLSLSAPKLKCLEIRGYGVNLNTFSHFPSLQTLTIVHNQLACSPDDVVLILQNCPSLRSAKLGGAKYSTSLAAFTERLPSLGTSKLMAQSLEELELYHFVFSSLSVIFAGVHLPALKSIRIAYADGQDFVGGGWITSGWAELLELWDNRIDNFSNVENLSLEMIGTAPDCITRLLSKFTFVQHLTVHGSSAVTPLQDSLCSSLCSSVRVLTIRGILMHQVMELLARSRMSSLEILNMDQQSAMEVRGPGVQSMTRRRANSIPRRPLQLLPEGGQLERLKKVVPSLNIYGKSLSQSIPYENWESFQAQVRNHGLDWGMGEGRQFGSWRRPFPG